MPQQQVSRFKYYLRWIFWVLLIQFILINITAAIYAHKFTHFYDGPTPVYNANKNILVKTWKLFVGPTFYKDTEEGVPPFSVETISFKEGSNQNIQGWYSSIDSSDKCVIILHGITANKSYMLSEAVKFHEWGYSVLMIDFRGHGKSDGNNSSFGVKETQELDSAFNYARLKGNRHIIIYGMSMGSIVAMKAISENKIQPQAVILDAPFGSLENHLKSRAAILGFPSQPFAFLVTLWIGIERGYNGFNHCGYNYAKKITCPVLMQWGQKDRYVRRAEINQIYNNIPGNNKKLVVYTNADHESYIQVEPTEWEKEVKGFISNLPK
jgi:alpha-beta hydrolase superfamily lysophospholipase